MQIILIFTIFIPQIIVTSPDQHFSAEIEYYPGTEIIAKSLTLKYDALLCYTKNSPQAATFFVNDQGNIFGIGSNALYLYSGQGDEILLQQLDAPNGFMFSPDCSVFFASDLGGLRAYNQNGTLKYAFPACRLFASSDMADIVATVNDENLFVYHKGSQIYYNHLTSPYVWSIEINEATGTIRLQLPTSIEEYKYRTGEEK